MLQPIIREGDTRRTNALRNTTFGAVLRAPDVRGHSVQSTVPGALSLFQRSVHM